MQKFINKLLNPPKDIKPGQVWYSPELEEDFIVLDIGINGDPTVVKTVMVSRLTKYGDKHDVLLTPENSKIFSSERIVFRITAGPMPGTKLKYFKGSLPVNVMKKIKTALGNIDFSNYDEQQKEVLGIILEKLNHCRIESVKSFEEGIKKSVSRNKPAAILSLIDKNEKAASYYKLAAESIDLVIKLDMIWSLVEKQQEETVNIYEDPNLIIDIIVLNNLPHLIFISAINAEINSVKLIKDGIFVKIADDTFTIAKEQKIITAIEPAKLEQGEWELTFNINSQPKSILFSIK